MMCLPHRAYRVLCRGILARDGGELERRARCGVSGRGTIGVPTLSAAMVVRYFQTAN